ncbi:hypothetical protein [Paractinoplanes toevensis]|uniref:Uncharacterized protein n=1 Tax=Paractinoplanes toevensis TaxID=571911 RepID=A0A919T9B1_9ACTN|nr:hypothetical protein [Actinoplanes toevensis]GIM91072.1 hypothetical protein Ato02nite_028650 [Actinoplanes toevensis]
MLFAMPALDDEDVRVSGALDAIRDIQTLTRTGLPTPQGNATTRVYLLSGVAADISEAAAAAVRSPGRDPYSRR